jgi:hypothetical protein
VPLNSLFQSRPRTDQKDDDSGENKKFRQLSLSPEDYRSERDEDALKQRLSFVVPRASL